jgi:3-oxoadipate CoA-transferase beta subunit
MMTLLTREGKSKLVEHCSYPLTGLGCVTRVYTDQAVFLITPDGVRVRETFGISFADLQELVPVPLVPVVPVSGEADGGAGVGAGSGGGAGTARSGADDPATVH